jgi:hypothetical protein
MAKPKMPFEPGTPGYQGWKKVSRRDKANGTSGQRGVVGDGTEITVERSDGGIVDAEIIRPRSWILRNGLSQGACCRSIFLNWKSPG